MNFTISLAVLIVLVGVFSVNAGTPSAVLYIQQRAETALYEQMIKSRSVPMPRSGISECHPHYSELLQNLLDTYEKELQKCEQDENEKLEGLATEGQQSRDDTTSILNEVCASLDVCKDESENLQFFDCVNQSGDKNTRNVWKASKDSSDTAAHIREQIHAIKYQTGRCTSEAERKYIVDTAKATDDMLACYSNGGPSTGVPSTAAPSTDAPSTGAPSTGAPSTEAPSTDAPSTAAPSTEAPSTDAPSTEAPSTEAPSTAAPSTEAPSTEAPSTEAPSTEAPSTAAPSTEAPSTAAPSTEAPSTEAPSTAAPSTEAPSTEAPSTAAPSTEAPSTAAPSTEAPSTAAPSTEAPSTEAPSTAAPSTAAPSTAQPTTAPPAESDEMDQVEELEESNAQARLANFMKTWGKRY